MQVSKIRRYEKSENVTGNFNKETSIILINIKYEIKKEIKINDKIIIAIFNIINSII